MTSRWRESMEAVPRRLFIPDTIWRETASGLLPLRRDDDPDRWLELASGEDSVITQVDDGRPVGPGLVGKLATSSASMPKLVAGMLEYLDAHEGQRVLEIGTGTGWNAALLAHRLGAEQITTIEVDPDVAAHARKALSGAGYGGVTTVVGDGALGYPPGAPYGAPQHEAQCGVRQRLPGPGRVCRGAEVVAGERALSCDCGVRPPAQHGHAIGDCPRPSSRTWPADRRRVAQRDRAGLAVFMVAPMGIRRIGWRAGAR